MSNYLIKNRCLVINGETPNKDKLGNQRVPRPYHLNIFTSGEYPDRLYINARDCRLSVDEATDLRDFLNDWLSQYKRDIKKSKNLNSAVMEAIKNIKE
jgi:hypothetical protein